MIPGRQTIRRVLVTFAGIALVVVAVLFVPPGGTRDIRAFDPDRLAVLETDMWQAYYRKERIRLTRDLITTLREQYHCSYANALRVGFHFGRAASNFAVATSHYDAVLPDLENGFVVVKSCIGADFDPQSVARAELAWWVARRIPETRAPEQVGALIADENALLFDTPRDRVLDASILRARAGRLRDDGGEQADWAQVSTLLHQSYRSLYDGVH